MSKKSYLSQQIKLITLTTSDLFTDEEFALYQKIMEKLTEMDRMDLEAKRAHVKADKEKKAELLAEKKAFQSELDALILKHDGKPRTVRVSGVVDTRTLPRDQNDEPIMPKGITWRTLRTSRKIAEFTSDMSRALGLQHNDITFDKIILKWKSVDILHQIVLDGFYMPILLSDGTVDMRHYNMVTASAGQLRRDKIQCMSDIAWDRIRAHVQCGLDWDTINAKGGLNISKLFAYTALTSGATDPWPEIDWNRIIVIKDFSGNVTGMVDFINPNYTVERGVRTVEIKHTDGCGMIRPDICSINFMGRGPYMKGLFTPWDWLRFCREHNVEPKLVDAWGKEHDLVAEDIWLIMTTSQFKLWKFYESWDQFKEIARANNCTMSRTNYEEAYIPDTTMNYQFIESLVDFTDEEMERFTKPTWDKIKGIATDARAMLRTLRADEFSELPYKRALYLYAPLLRDGYSYCTLRDIKKRWTEDAQSGRIITESKRLYVIPDMYAACEYWFLGVKEPKGLLQNGEVFARVYFHCDEVDCLRSPSLYMEHAVRKVNHDSWAASWFISNGIYTSIHDLISRVLQFDCDGDQLNVVANKDIVAIAKRNIEKYDIVPLFYDANEVPPEIINRETMFRGLVRAHDSSGIGQISNNLCKLWNSDNPDYDSAKLLCYYNNQVIDGAKLPVINDYSRYPEIKQKIDRAIGGVKGRMPHFFQHSRNGRHNANNRVNKKKTFKPANGSIMNRICEKFSHIGNMNMNYAGVAPFNDEMLLSGPVNGINTDAVNLFCDMDNANLLNQIDSDQTSDLSEKYNACNFDAVKDQIVEELTYRYGDLENIYPSIEHFLFSGENVSKQNHKQMFWRVFGDIAVRNLENNVIACRECPNCGMQIPLWGRKHICGTEHRYSVVCQDCGRTVVRTNSKQVRCPMCQEKYRENYAERYRRKILGMAPRKKKSA